jgi:hypothetical protein
MRHNIANFTIVHCNNKTDNIHNYEGFGEQIPALKEKDGENIFKGPMSI